MEDSAGSWYWEGDKKVYRNDLELQILEAKIPCTCKSDWCFHLFTFPSPCKIEGYKKLIRSNLIDGLLSNYQWLRELATEVAQEMKNEI